MINFILCLLASTTASWAADRLARVPTNLAKNIVIGFFCAVIVTVVIP